MTKHITYVTFDMHQDSITAAWLQADAQTPEVRAIPHEPKCFRQLVPQLLGHGLACLLRGGGLWDMSPSGNSWPGASPAR